MKHSIYGVKLMRGREGQGTLVFSMFKDGFLF